MMEVNNVEVLWIKVMPKQDTSNIFMYAVGMYILFSSNGVFENT